MYAATPNTSSDYVLGPHSTGPPPRKPLDQALRSKPAHRHDRVLRVHAEVGREHARVDDEEAVNAVDAEIGADDRRMRVDAHPCRAEEVTRDEAVRTRLERCVVEERDLVD